MPARVHSGDRLVGTSLLDRQFVHDWPNLRPADVPEWNRYAFWPVPRVAEAVHDALLQERRSWTPRQPAIRGGGSNASGMLRCH